MTRWILALISNKHFSVAVAFFFNNYVNVTQKFKHRLSMMVTPLQVSKRVFNVHRNHKGERGGGGREGEIIYLLLLLSPSE